MKEKEKSDDGESQEKLFYLENGFVVFMEAYHLKRGYCCKNGCRHCPYGYKKKRDDKLERG